MNTILHQIFSLCHSDFYKAGFHGEKKTCSFLFCIMLIMLHVAMIGGGIPHVNVPL